MLLIRKDKASDMSAVWPPQQNLNTFNMNKQAKIEANKSCSVPS